MASAINEHAQSHGNKSQSLKRFIAVVTHTEITSVLSIQEIENDVIFFLNGNS